MGGRASISLGSYPSMQICAPPPPPMLTGLSVSKTTDLCSVTEISELTFTMASTILTYAEDEEELDPP